MTLLDVARMSLPRFLATVCRLVVRTLPVPPRFVGSQMCLLPLFAGLLYVCVARQAAAVTIRVPEDQPTIQAAIDAASGGDVIDIAPGLYNISSTVLLNKPVTLAARVLYQSILDGGGTLNPIVRVQSAATVQGFVFQNAFVGLEQRFSPNVDWHARNLILRNLGTAIGVNDQFTQIGAAIVANVVADKCDVAFGTNDARGIDVRNSVIRECHVGFVGGDVGFFRVSHTVFFDVDIFSFGEPVTVGPGVVEADPQLTDVTLGTLLLPLAGRCGGALVDAGDPATEFEDVSFPPSLGTTVNDIGAYGGPGAGLMLNEEERLDFLRQVGCPHKVNKLVTFNPLIGTFGTSMDSTGCPAPAVGRFSFSARLVNVSDVALSSLKVEVATLTSGYLLQNADGGPGGEGAQLTVPSEGGLADGLLTGGEFVDVPFIVCLPSRDPFTLLVDVAGIEE